MEEISTLQFNLTKFGERKDAWLYAMQRKPKSISFGILSTIAICRDIANKNIVIYVHSYTYKLWQYIEIPCEETKPEKGRTVEGFYANQELIKRRTKVSS